MSSSGREVRRVVAPAVLGLAFICAPAWSADFSGQYLCIDEFGGGGYYEAGRWNGVKFNPSGKFVFSLEKINERPSYDGSETMLEVYSAKLSDFGSTGEPDLCIGSGVAGTVELSKWSPIVKCEGIITMYWFNPERLRYLSAYPRGWITGDDNNSNTPSMMGGSCARL
jgi:hypothetical protein